MPPSPPRHLVRELLCTSIEPADAVSLLHLRAARLGIAAPAALCGDWFSSRAVLVPTLETTTTSCVDEAFTVPTRQPAVSGVDGHAVGGGWVGYLAYDLIDPSLRTGELPKAVWGWTDHVLRQDHQGRWWFEALVGDSTLDPAELAAEFDALFTGGVAPTSPTRSTRLHRAGPREHQQAVRGCINAIEAGELFQANICTRWHGRFNAAAIDVFTAGVQRLRPARSAFLAGDWGAVTSFSPELFLAREGNRVRSTPIKGTRPRRGPHDDHLARELRESIKDTAENVMITDLVRNDFGKVCQVGSVWVPTLLAVRPAPGVWHLESTVEGVLAPGTDDADLLRACFPPGSVTGAPKIRALHEISALEREARGVYTGAMGLASPVAGTEFNVAIRTLEMRNGQVALGVGGGITAESDPAAEWAECLHKAAPLEELLDGRY